jgi:site-specific DNA-cytosine methylase
LLNALDCQSFAGAFTLGVSLAGFRVVGKREMPGGYGVQSVAANADLFGPGGLPIQVSTIDRWEPADVELLFGNPPCSGFSAYSKAAMRGSDSKINDCMWALVELASRCGSDGPPVVAFESVRLAYTQGRDLMTALLADLNARTSGGYVLYHVLHNSLGLGGCSVRPRYFWVASRIPLGLRAPVLERVPVLDEVIGDLAALSADDTRERPVPGPSSWWSAPLRRSDGLVDGHAIVDNAETRRTRALLRDCEWLPGEENPTVMRRHYERTGTLPPEFSGDQLFRLAGKEFNLGAYKVKRWWSDRPAPVLHGGSLLRSAHPYLPRPLSLREAFRVQGFPDAWLLRPAIESAPKAMWQGWAGKGIPVPVGRWLADCLRASLEGRPYEPDRRLTRVGEAEYLWDGSDDWKRLYNARTGERLSA